MLTQDDIQLIENVFEKRIEAIFDKKFAEQKSELKTMIRQEVEVEAKETRRELGLRMTGMEGKLSGVTNRLNAFEQTANERFDTLELKIEAFHSKLDKKIDYNHKDVKASFETLYNTMDALQETMGKRVANLEKRAGFPQS